MPGPLSAPNGERRLTLMKGEKRAQLAASKMLDTGKTAQKKEK